MSETNRADTAHLTDAGEMLLLAAATMGGIRPSGRGERAAARKLVRDGYAADQAGECVATAAGRAALVRAGYDMRTAA